MPALELKSSTPAEFSMNYVPVLAIALAATIAAMPNPRRTKSLLGLASIDRSA